MASQWLGKTTFSVTEPGWDGDTFADADALEMWLECPADLQAIVRAESAAGNLPWNILRNVEQGIILVALSGPPRTGAPNTRFRVHTSFANGNYCYDGTVCTYEHIPSGCFVTFEDPAYEDPARYGAL